MPSDADALSLADVTTHLREVKYPADREALLRCARESRAPEEVLTLIGAMPDQIYGGVAEVTEKLEGALIQSGKLPAEDRVDKASEDSFPASDSPSYMSSLQVGKPRDGGKTG